MSITLSSRPGALFALAGLLSLSGCGNGEPAPPPEAIEKGRALYLRACALCHGKTADGMPSLGKGLRGNAFTQGLSDSDLVEFLKVGRSASDPLNQTGIDMPPNGGDPRLTEEDLKDIVAYLRAL